MQATRATGFTLVELLVAIAIFALIGSMSYRALHSSIETRDRVSVQNDRWRALSRFFLMFEDDLTRSLGRDVRVASGAMQPGFLGKSAWSAADDAQLLLVRAESAELAEPLAGTSRVGYRHSGDRVERLFWPAPDALAGGWPRVNEALRGVKSMRMRFLSESALWREAWPFPQDPRARPNGVEISLTLESGETITRFFSLI